MKIINTSRCGQSIAELLLALAIGAIFMVATMTVVIPALRENGQTENIQQSATIAQDLLGNVRVWSESGWNNITALATGTTHQYYLITSSSPYMATSGIQSIVVGTTTYIRSFYLSDVYRTSGGGIASSPDGNTYDPSTKQVSVVYDWAHGVTSTMSAYLTRNGDAVTDQTDWSGGPNPESIATSAGSQFASSSNINYSSTVGSIFVFGS